MLKIRVTPDSELATPEAIEFRIAAIRKECNGILTPQAASRIAKLRNRLPAKPGGEIRPAVNAALLVSKSDVDEYSPNVSRYASPSCSY